MDTKQARALFTDLFQSESEEAVIEVLKKAGLWEFDKKNWKILGAKENNQAIVGNQTIQPHNALVEKLTNSVDAMIMLKAAEAGEDKKNSPKSVKEAVERYFEIPEGKIENLQTRSKSVRNLTKNIQMFATGVKNRKPSITFADKGIGQSVDTIEQTFLSINETNKTNIPYLQGSFNQGGLATLVFSGKNRMNLIATRMAPSVNKKHNTEWCFTIIRYIDPEILGTEVPIYYYLAPKGKVLTIGDEPIDALPGQDRHPYLVELDYGSIVKCYSYDTKGWKGSQNIVGEPRYYLEEIYAEPALPIRMVDCRHEDTTFGEGNFYGYWAQAKDNFHNGKKMMTLEGDYGTIKISYGVFDIAKSTDKQGRSTSSGIHVVYNGQTHGVLPVETISKKDMLNFPFLKDRLRVDINLTEISSSYRTKIFSTSRDRLIQSEEYHQIRKDVVDLLKNNKDLKELNAYYQSLIAEKAKDTNNSYFERFLQSNEHISRLLTGKAAKKGKVMPKKELTEYEGKNFPTFFEWSKSKTDQVKVAPINHEHIRTFATTDAENLYFDRAVDKGTVQVFPKEMLKSYDLINGKLNFSFNMPDNVKVGQQIPVRIVISDKVQEFELTHVIKVGKAAKQSKGPSVKNDGRKQGSTGKLKSNKGGLPNVTRSTAEKLQEMFPKSFDKRYSVFCEGDMWFLNQDNDDLRIMLTDKEYRAFGSDFIVDQFEKALLLNGLSLKQGESTDELVNESLAKMSAMQVPIIHGLSKPI